MTTNTLDLSALTVTDTAAVKVTRKRKPRQLSPLAASITASFKDGKWKQLPPVSEAEVAVIKRTLRADATQLGLGLSLHIEDTDPKTKKAVIKFCGKQKRGNSQVVTA